MIDSNRPKIREIMNLEQNFSLLFFEHGFLSYYIHCQPEMCCVPLEGSMSQIVYLGPGSHFMTKNG